MFTDNISSKTGNAKLQQYTTTKLNNTNTNYNNFFSIQQPTLILPIESNLADLQLKSTNSINKKVLTQNDPNESFIMNKFNNSISDSGFRAAADNERLSALLTVLRELTRDTQQSNSLLLSQVSSLYSYYFPGLAKVRLNSNVPTFEDLVNAAEKYGLIKLSINDQQQKIELTDAGRQWLSQREAQQQYHSQDDVPSKTKDDGASKEVVEQSPSSITFASEHRFSQLSSSAPTFTPSAQLMSSPEPMIDPDDYMTQYQQQLVTSRQNNLSISLNTSKLTERQTQMCIDKNPVMKQSTGLSSWNARNIESNSIQKSSTFGNHRDSIGVSWDQNATINQPFYGNTFQQQTSSPNSQTLPSSANISFDDLNGQTSSPFSASFGSYPSSVSKSLTNSSGYANNFEPLFPTINFQSNAILEEKYYRHEKPRHLRYMFSFRVNQCQNFNLMKTCIHDTKKSREGECFDWHSAKMRRRVPKILSFSNGIFFSYNACRCQAVEKDAICEKGDSCRYAHNKEEIAFHPSRFKSQLCSYPAKVDGVCTRFGVHCAFAHGIDDLRQPILLKQGLPHRHIPDESNQISISTMISNDAAQSSQHNGISLNQLSESFNRNNNDYTASNNLKNKISNDRNFTNSPETTYSFSSQTEFVHGKYNPDNLINDLFDNNNLSNSLAGFLKSKANQIKNNSSTTDGIDTRAVFSITSSSTQESEKVFDRNDYINVSDNFVNDRLFFLYHYKVFECIAPTVACSRAMCPYYHSDFRRRRSLLEYHYTSELCLNVINEDGSLKDSSFCPQGDRCEKSHTQYEVFYHPLIYKLVKCPKFDENDSTTWNKCPFKKLCPFAHSDEELVFHQKCSQIKETILDLNSATMPQYIADIVSETLSSNQQTISEASPTKSLQSTNCASTTQSNAPQLPTLSSVFTSCRSLSQQPSKSHSHPQSVPSSISSSPREISATSHYRDSTVSIIRQRRSSTTSVQSSITEDEQSIFVNDVNEKIAGTGDNRDQSLNSFENSVVLPSNFNAFSPHAFSIAATTLPTPNDSSNNSTPIYQTGSVNIGPISIDDLSDYKSRYLRSQSELQSVIQILEQEKSKSTEMKRDLAALKRRLSIMSDEKTQTYLQLSAYSSELHTSHKRIKELETSNQDKSKQLERLVGELELTQSICNNQRWEIGGLKEDLRIKQNNSLKLQSEIQHLKNEIQCQNSKSSIAAAPIEQNLSNECLENKLSDKENKDLNKMVNDHCKSPRVADLDTAIIREISLLHCSTVSKS